MSITRLKGRARDEHRGSNQRVLIADPYVAAASLMRLRAAWGAGSVAAQTYGGYGMTLDDDNERKRRETRLSRVASISTNLALPYLAEHALGLLRSY